MQGKSWQWAIIMRLAASLPSPYSVCRASSQSWLAISTVIGLRGGQVSLPTPVKGGVLITGIAIPKGDYLDCLQIWEGEISGRQWTPFLPEVAFERAFKRPSRQSTSPFRLLLNNDTPARRKQPWQNPYDGCHKKGRG